MIGWLSGTIRYAFPDRVIVETGGVGYEVHVPTRIAAEYVEPGEPVEFYIHTHVREDNIMLFGFSTLTERDFFQLLMTVSGVGAKTAIHILSSLPMDQLIDAIRSNNAALLKTTPGIGKRTAERLVLELKDKIHHFKTPKIAAAATRASVPSSKDDLVSALINLGYKQQTIEATLARLDLSNFDSFDTMLKESLKVLSR